MHRLRFWIGLAVACAIAAVVLASPVVGSSRGKALANKELTARVEMVRKATERFKDINVALKEGYVRDPMDMCIGAPFEGQPRQLGNMGIHFFRPDLLQLTATTPRVTGNGTHTDFLTPGVLIYEPQANGQLRLVAVENLVFADAWQAAGNTQPPEFEGYQYYRMIDNPVTTDIDEAHGFMPHYELHMWLYRDNPNGMFAPFNPDVTCQYHKPNPNPMQMK
jgi:hypothetical protein